MTEQKRYLVTWVMDQYADSPQEAAIFCLDVHRDPESTSTVFEVQEVTEPAGKENIGPCYTIDCTPDDNYFELINPICPKCNKREESEPDDYGFITCSHCGNIAMGV